MTTESEMSEGYYNLAGPVQDWLEMYRKKYIVTVQSEFSLSKL